ncbi:PEP-CTERM sorting domain-containing protein [Paucibacter sp. PLA-PC-4]|uniref:beta strand repeat-containing protein n=1 Tax=Paucibacter sp. PLA-PC-4 TaxID=2993655 RepID=UPI00224B7E68|nr:PEP-CTERM sorting domain-containing protein [Paucibacter sp. PLA-PC-4]MCX2864922.1 PEP-CTERM sorting domain-containing protein [Paucibacter sp. PLA-PC-4]
MTRLSRVSRRLLRHSALTTASVLALLGSQATIASSVTVGVNSWLGSANTDWFHASNWWAGDLFNLPDPIFPVYFGPVQWIVNGVPTDTYDKPSSEAVLRGAFSTSSLDMRAWDGISQLRLDSGAQLAAGSASIGQLHTVYQPSGPIQKATLVLAGGQISGSLSFYSQSRVVVSALYDSPSGNWSGTLGELQIDSGAALTLPSGSLTIAQISNAGELKIASAGKLTLAGAVQNSGSFTLGGSGNVGTAALYLAGNTILTGNGSTVLTDANYSYLGGTGVLTVGQGHTLRGSGYAAVGIVNQGSVVADGVLTVNAGSGNTFDNSGGQVQVAGAGMLALSGGTFSGGTLHGLDAGSRLGGNGRFQNVALSGSLTLTGGTTLDSVSNTGALALAGGHHVNTRGTLTNTGTLTIGGSGNVGTAALYLAADTTLAGNGSTVLTDANYSYLGGTGVLTVGQGHTLRGKGYAAIGITNNGKVIADGTLTVNAGTGAIFDNSNGLVQVADAGLLSLAGGTFTGGTLQGLGAGSRMGGSGTFQNIALQGTWQVTPSVPLSVAGTVTNSGTLTIGGSGNTGTARLNLAGNTTLAGSGSTVLSDANYSTISGNGVLTVAQGHTLRGSGYVTASIANQSSVIAEGQLTVNAGTGNAFDNSAGQVQVASNGLLSLAGGTFTGGTLHGMGTGSRLAGNGSFKDVAVSGTLLLTGGTTLDSVSSTGELTLAGGHSVNTRGTLINTGTLTIGGSGNTGTARLNLAGNTTLAGAGSTVLSDANYSTISGSGVLTVAQGHTLRGSGYVTASITNQGSVIADGQLTVNAGTGNAFDNSAGLVHVGSNGLLSLAGGTFIGGMLQGTTIGSRLAGNGTFKDVALSGTLLLTGGTTLDAVSSTGQVTLAGGHSVNTRGTLISTGTLTINGSGNTGTARLNLAGDTTLAGAGSTVLSDANYSTVSGSGSLTVAQGHTLRGSGYVTASIANQGSVIADGQLTVNAGTGNAFDNSAGLVRVGSNGLLSLAGGTFTGGTLHGMGTASRLGGSGTFQNIALQGTWQVTPNLPLSVAGTVTNSGTLTISGSGNTGTARLSLTGNTTLAGSGSTVLTDANYSTISGTGALTVAKEHTLRGPGYVTTQLTNQGNVLVDSGDVLHVAGVALRNQGQFHVNANGTLNAGGIVSGYVQDGASATTIVDGLLKASTLRLEAGTLKGSGTVQADVINLGGTIAAGNSPGVLTIDGDLTLGTDSLLVVEVAGLLQGAQYDWLRVNGDVTLGGALQLDFGGYKPVIGETYSFLTSGNGLIDGSFARVFANGYELTMNYGTDGVIAKVAAVSAVPEPATYGLMMLGLGLLGGYARRQQKCGRDNPARLAASRPCTMA